MRTIITGFTHALLGELVHALLARRAAGLEHLKDTLLVRLKADDLTDNVADHGVALGSVLHNTTETTVSG